MVENLALRKAGYLVWLMVDCSDDMKVVYLVCQTVVRLVWQKVASWVLKLVVYLAFQMVAHLVC